jgi:hypothetical protein
MRPASSTTFWQMFEFPDLGALEASSKSLRLHVSLKGGWERKSNRIFVLLKLPTMIINFITQRKGPVSPVFAGIVRATM